MLARLTQDSSSFIRAGSRAPGRWLRGLLLLLFLVTSGAPAAAQKVDLQITTVSEGPGKDIVAVAYARKPADEQVRKDFAQIAAGLGLPTPKVRISHEEGITVGEAEFSHLTDWSTGVINLDPFIRTYRRFGRFRATFFFLGKFPLKASGSVVRPPVRIEQRVSGSTVDYQIWVDQSGGVPAEVPSVIAQPGPGWRVWVGLAAMALVVLVSILLIANVIRNQRRAAAAREGKG